MVAEKRAMDSAFYSCVDDTIEDAFDASSDTEPADSDVSITQTQLDTDNLDTDLQEQTSLHTRNCSEAADWLTDGRRERLSKDSVVQGNSAGNPDVRNLPATSSFQLHQSSADNEYSLTGTDVYDFETSNLYDRKSDATSSRQSLLNSKARTEPAAAARSRDRRHDNAVYLTDDKVMEIVEEQLENDDDDDEDDEDECVVDVKPAAAAAAAAADDDDMYSDADDSETGEVEEISEDDEDRLADEEKAVLEAARAAAEAAALSPSASAAAGDDKTTDIESERKAGSQSTQDATCELGHFKKFYDDDDDVCEFLPD